MLFYTILILIGCIVIVSLVAWIFLQRQVDRHEKHLISLYIEKIGKIPAIIETMRPFVADEKAFDTLVRLHRDAMMSTHDSLYDILGHNLLIQREFEFLMKLSVQIPEIQKKEYFLYMRDFIIKYERNMKNYFKSVNKAIKNFNLFVTIKNATLIGYLLPGEKMNQIV
jgi:hypothetical protein